jgi:hypothetical protein
MWIGSVARIPRVRIGLLVALSSSLTLIALSGPGTASAARAATGRSCAAVVGAVRAHSQSQDSLREASVLCGNRVLMGSSGPMTVSLVGSTLTITSETTMVPTAECAANVTSQLPAGTSASDVTTAVNEACAVDAITTASVTAVAPAPAGASPDPSLPAAGPNIPSRFPVPGVTVWQVTASAEECSGLWPHCTLWHQTVKELYFIQFHDWVWHNLAGYNWSYVDCDDNGGIGYTVSVNRCFWGGRNPGFTNNPLTANVHFHVTVLFNGVPISYAHSIEQIDWVRGGVTSVFH